MAYTALEGRQKLLDGLAQAVDELGYALASLGAAYEQLDDATADKLEEELFGPTQRAYGRAKRTYAEFAARHGVEGRAFQAQSPGPASARARGLIDEAVAGLGGARTALEAVQDEPALLEVGDAELRAGLAEVRGIIDPLALRARELVRRLGR